MTSFVFLTVTIYFINDTSVTSFIYSSHRILPVDFNGTETSKK